MRCSVEVLLLCATTVFGLCAFIPFFLCHVSTALRLVSDWALSCRLSTPSSAACSSFRSPAQFRAYSRMSLFCCCSSAFLEHYRRLGPAVADAFAAAAACEPCCGYCCAFEHTSPITCFLCFQYLPGIFTVSFQVACVSSVAHSTVHTQLVSPAAVPALIETRRMHACCHCPSRGFPLCCRHMLQCLFRHRVIVAAFLSIDSAAQLALGMVQRFAGSTLCPQAAAA